MTISESTRIHTQATPPGTSQFFDLNAKYLVANENTPDDLLSDASCLMNLSIGLLNKHADAAELPEVWSALYMMRQAYGSLEAAHRKLISGVPLFGPDDLEEQED